ncbi:MAG TPA: hypothetical protein DCQ06_07265 [Myxococcales bacterium]|nr:hypothetical protein [Myxococcales bacterium]HAN31380.1 hypothetical protein [Myxococcales bacterium]
MCHHYVPKQRHDVKPRVHALISVCIFLFGCTAESDLFLVPLGDHEALVGEPIEIALVSISSTGEALSWTLQTGPNQMVVTTLEGRVVLAWTATILDLYPVAPGSPRMAGKWHDIEVRACNKSGFCEQTRGRVRAVPTPTQESTP